MARMAKAVRRRVVRGARRARATRKVVRLPTSIDLGKFMKAPASGATRGAGLIFTGGYVAHNPRTGEPETGSIEVETRQTLQNLKEVIERAGSSMDKVLKVNVFMTDLNDWPKMNKVYKKFFPRNFPARRTVQSGLVPGYRVEIEFIALQ
ncbi:MAG: RidA family protein [Alphaproteobacteria bacterium]